MIAAGRWWGGVVVGICVGGGEVRGQELGVCSQISCPIIGDCDLRVSGGGAR